MELFDRVLNIGENEEIYEKLEILNSNAQEAVEEPTDQEVEEEYKQLKNNRSGCVDETT